jgi:hypothetical protein
MKRLLALVLLLPLGPVVPPPGPPPESHPDSRTAALVGGGSDASPTPTGTLNETARSVVP